METQANRQYELQLQALTMLGAPHTHGDGGHLLADLPDGEHGLNPAAVLLAVKLSDAQPLYRTSSSESAAAATNRHDVCEVFSARERDKKGREQTVGMIVLNRRSWRGEESEDTAMFLRGASADNAIHRAGSLLDGRWGDAYEERQPGTPLPATVFMAAVSTPFRLAFHVLD